ncbi:Integrator complex subunit 4 [Linnemannia zychae]|nr:Integrator complex subunit 4 [Linnemannia zychae]
MKRPNQDDSQDASGRGKQAKIHGLTATATSGSHTFVQPEVVLALQPHTEGDDMNVDSDSGMNNGDSISMDEDQDYDSDEDGSISNQALKLLLNRLADLTAVERESLLKIARKYVYTEGDKEVKLHADSTEVRVHIYDAITYIIKIGRLQRNNNSDINTIRALITTSVSELSDRHHRVRSAVLQLVSQLAPLLRTSDVQTTKAEGKQAGYSQHDIQVIISNYVTDPEPRVRKNALKALLGLHQEGFKIGLVMYDVAILAILDDYQEVRMAGLDLIFILSRLYPDQIIQNPKDDIDQRTRLADDAFVRICDMVNDSSMVVRAKRAKLIATPEGDQDVTTQPVRLLDSGACGAFIHGLEDEYQDVRNSAINSICELCLHNPEFAILALDYLVDMFMDEIDYVRLNALQSLCKIGNRAPISFDTEQLQIALGVLEDADRDVREAAHRMLEVITMSTQEGMTSFLESIEINMRRFPEDQLSIYQCMRTVGRRHGVFLDGGHLVLLFNAATTNPTILKMLPKFTFKHYTYLRDQYLNCFPEPSEIPCPGTQSLRDLAAALTMTITHDGQDDAFTNIDQITGVQDGATNAYATTIAAMRIQTEEDAEAYYEQVLQNIDRIHVLLRQQQLSQNHSRTRPDLIKRHREVLLRQLLSCQQDLEYIVNVHTKQGRNAEFATMYLECCQLLVQIQESYDSPSFIMLAPILSAQLFRLSYYMDHIFLGLDATAKISVGYFRVLANLVWFFGMVQKKATTSTSGSSTSDSGSKEGGVTREYLQSMLQQAIKRLTDLQAQMDSPEVNQEQIKDTRIALGDLRVALLRAFKSPSTLEVVRLLASIVRFRPMEINFRNLNLHRISAEVTRPATNRDRPTDIHPSFPFLIPVEGFIHNVRDTTGVAIQVTFPNGNVRHYYPPPDHFIPVEDENKDKSSSGELDIKEGENSPDAIMDVSPSEGTSSSSTTPTTYRLRTSIEIYPETSWGTSPIELRITLSRSFQPDLVGHDEFICRFAEEIATEKRHQQALLQRGIVTDLIGQNNGQSSASSSSSSSAAAAATLSVMSHSTGLLSHPRGLLSLGSVGGSSQISRRRLRTVAQTSRSEAHVSQNQSTLEISKSIPYYVARRAMFNS